MTASLIEKMTIPVSVCVIIISVNFQQTFGASFSIMTDKIYYSFGASFSVMTDKSYYLQGEPVEISGKIPPGNGQEVSMTIFADNVPISHRNLSAENGSYNYRYIAGNPREYFVKVSAGSLYKATYFNVLSSYNIKIGDQNYKIGYDVLPELMSYLCTGTCVQPPPPTSVFRLNSITPDTNSHSLLVKLFTNGEGLFTIELPRNVIQALTSVGVPSGGSDTPFKVLVDGIAADADEVVSNEKTRVLQLDLSNAGTYDIQIIGTWLAR